MSKATYERVIEQWAGATGMKPWPVDTVMNVEIAGTVTGLIYEEDRNPHVLHVLADLGRVTRPDLATTLLQLNYELDRESSTFFALDPANDSVILRMTVPLTEDLDGSLLPAEIHSAVEYARQQLVA